MSIQNSHSMLKQHQMMHDNKPFLFCHQTCLRVETMEPGMKQNIPVNLKFNKNCLGLFLINETNYPKVTTYIWKY